MAIFNFFKKPKHESEETYRVINSFLIVGTQFKCKKDNKKQRADVIKKQKTLNKVYLEKYTYQGKPAYLVIDSKTNLDLGTLSQGAAFMIADTKINDSDFDCYLDEPYRGSFHVVIRVKM